MTGKDFVFKVIEMYRNSPCLWQSTHNDYQDKNKRNAALEELLQLFQKVDSNANMDTVQKKIRSLRGAFKKELNKVKNSMLSGAGTNEIHVPKLWYYNHMLFLEEIDSPRPSKTPRSALDDMPFEEFEETNEDVLSPHSQASTSTLKKSPSIKETSFKRTKATADLVLNKISKRLVKIDNQTANQQKEIQDSSDAFGQYVASEMRDLPDNMKKICKKIINDAIFQAAMGQLNLTSRIVTDSTLFQHNLTAGKKNT